MKQFTCDDCGVKIPENEVHRNETCFGDDGDFCQDCFYENHFDFGEDDETA